MPKLVRMQDPNDTLANAADIFSFESAANLRCPTMLALRGEDCVPYELDDLLRVLLQQGTGPMTRKPFRVEDIEPLRLIDTTQDSGALEKGWQRMVDGLLEANVLLGDISGSTWRVRSLLSAGANPNTLCDVPIIHAAIARGNYGAFYALLDAGASLRSIDSDGNCALLCAVSSGLVCMTRRVLSSIVGSNKRKKRRVTSRNFAGHDAMDIAVRKDHLSIIKLLIDEFGGVVDAAKCMFTAVELGHAAIAEFFIDLDPKLLKGRRSGDGRCALTVAAAGGRTSVMDLLIGKYGMSPADMDVVCAAARHDRSGALIKLRTWCDDDDAWRRVMETKDREGVRPIMAALLNGAYDAMQTLAVMGADPTEALFDLVRIDQAERLRLLMEFVADTERLENLRYKNDTLLTWAIIHRSVECMVVIVSIVPDLWVAPRAGVTPINMIIDQATSYTSEREEYGADAMLNIWLNIACQRYADD